ncbi:MAG: HNH endonuclease, partial [bacterium]
HQSSCWLYVPYVHFFSACVRLRKGHDLPHRRLIPTWIKVAVWKRDSGKCVICGSKDNLHFDHILPFSRGGASITPENVQLLCMRHNLQKSNKIK